MSSGGAEVKAPDRGAMYADLRILVTRGFLTMGLGVGGTRLVVRSLTKGDYDYLQDLVPLEAPDWTLWVAARSVWIVDGLDVLEGGSSAFWKIRKHLGGLPGEVTRALWDAQVRLYNRSTKASQYLPPFLYEEESRHLWATTARGVRPVPGALPGVSNPIQGSWVAYNVLEDERLLGEREWGTIRPLIGVQSQQAMKSILKADRERSEREASHREQVIEDAWKAFRGGGPTFAPNPHYKPKSGPKEVADLAEEMRRWVAGELDEHDQIVERYKQRVREAMAERKAVQEEALRTAAPRPEDVPPPRPILPGEDAPRKLNVRSIAAEGTGSESWARHLQTGVPRSLAQDLGSRHVALSEPEE